MDKGNFTLYKSSNIEHILQYYGTEKKEQKQR